MSIFAKPQSRQENTYGVKILYLHGLEGTPSGRKATHLRKEWAAFTPSLRTQDVSDLREKCNGDWRILEAQEIEGSMKDAYEDAVDAVKYLQPDIIVGSSLGAALLYRLYADGHYEGAGVFLAPAVPYLLSPESIAKGKQNIKPSSTMWLLGEADTIVPNSENADICRLVGGNILYSPSDGHRLNKALESGLIDAAVLTAIEALSVR